MSEVITEETKKIFAKNLKELIERREISVRSLASEIGVSDAIINYYLSGKRYPRVNIMGRICDYFGVSLRYMVTDHDAEQPHTLYRTSAQQRIMALTDDMREEEQEQIAKLIELWKSSH